MLQGSSVGIHSLNSQNRKNLEHDLPKISQKDEVDDDDDNNDDDLGPMPDWVRRQTMPASRTADQKGTSKCQSLEANYGDQKQAYEQFASDDSPPEMPQWARIAMMPSLPNRDGQKFSDDASSCATTCDHSPMLRQMSESTNYETSSTMSPSLPGSSTTSPFQWANPQARTVLGLPDPIAMLNPVVHSIGSARALPTPQRTSAPSIGPIAPCTPDAGLPVAAWDQLRQMGHNPLHQVGQQYLASPMMASMGSKVDPRNSTPVAAQNTWSSSVQKKTPTVPSCPVQHGMMMKPGFMPGATSTNLPAGISNQAVSGTSSAGVAPSVLNETMAALGVRQNLLNELEANILQEAMPEIYQD